MVCFAIKNLRKCFKVAFNNPVMYFITRDEFNKLSVFWMEFGVLPCGRSDRPVSCSRPNSASNAKILNLEKKNQWGKQRELFPGGYSLILPYRYVPSHRVGFLSRFGLRKRVYTLSILVWNRLWFSRGLRSV